MCGHGCWGRPAAEQLDQRPDRALHAGQLGTGPGLGGRFRQRATRCDPNRLCSSRNSRLHLRAASIVGTPTLFTDGVASTGTQTPGATFSYVGGDASAGLTFASLPSPDFTLCSVSRFRPGGAAQSRVLSAAGADAAHGHYNGLAGTASYGGAVLVASTPATVAASTSWVGMCVRSAAGAPVWVNGALLAQTGVLQSSYGAITVNGAQGGGGSDAWGVAELLMYNRSLSDADIELMDDSYLDIQVCTLCTTVCEPRLTSGVRRGGSVWAAHQSMCLFRSSQLPVISQ